MTRSAHIAGSKFASEITKQAIIALGLGSAGGLAWHFGVSVPTRSRINNFYEDYNKKNPVRASVYKTEEGIAMIGNVDLNDPEVKKILDSIDTKVDE